MTPNFCFIMKTNQLKPWNELRVSNSRKVSMYTVWHYILGHSHHDASRGTLKACNMTIPNKTLNDCCSSYCFGKANRPLLLQLLFEATCPIILKQYIYLGWMVHAIIAFKNSPPLLSYWGHLSNNFKNIYIYIFGLNGSCYNSFQKFLKII